MSKKQIMLILLLTASLLSSGCTGEGIKKLSISGNDTEINIDLPETNESSWCPVGSHIQVRYPATGKTFDMTVVGTEEFEGETLCKALLETSSEEGTSKFEYMWSEDKNTTVWTKYDLEGNVSVKYIYKDGKKTIMDGAGRTLEFGE